MPLAKIRTRSKIPNSLRDEVENQKVAAKSIPGTRADLAEPVFALGDQKGRGEPIAIICANTGAYFVSLLHP